MGKEADRPPKVIVCINQFCFNSVSGKFLVDGVSLVLLLLNGLPSYVYVDVYRNLSYVGSIYFRNNLLLIQYI